MSVITIKDQSADPNSATDDPWTNEQMAIATPLHHLVLGAVGHGAFLSMALDAADEHNVFAGFVYNNGWGAWGVVYRLDVSLPTPTVVSVGTFKCADDRKGDSLVLKVAGSGLLIGMTGHVATAGVPDADQKVLDLGYLPNVVVPAMADKAFNDVADADWWAPYIHLLVRRGALSGYQDGSFKPGANVTRAQFAKGVALAALRFVGFNPPAWLKIGH